MAERLIKQSRQTQHDLPTFYFDGNCHFCKRSVKWLDKRINKDSPNLRFEPLLDSANCSLNPKQISVAEFRQTQNSDPLYGYLAIAEALKSSSNKSDRLMGAGLKTKILRPLAKSFYRLIARNRHKL